MYACVRNYELLIQNLNLIISDILSLSKIMSLYIIQAFFFLVLTKKNNLYFNTFRYYLLTFFSSKWSVFLTIYWTISHHMIMIGSYQWTNLGSRRFQVRSMNTVLGRIDLWCMYTGLRFWYYMRIYELKKNQSTMSD